VQQAATAMDEYQEIVDDALQLVYSQHSRIISRLYPAAKTRLGIEQLREGPLGEDLTRLAHIAAGAVREGRDEVLGAIDSVLQLLFWPVGADTYMVPRSFWEQPLGKMLSLAKLRSFEPQDLVSIGQAAQHLKVTRPTIYRWMDDKSLDYVRDDMSGRTFVVRQDVEAMKADMEAAEASGKHEFSPGL
jgi:excisionase family DNA binding protein